MEPGRTQLRGSALPVLADDGLVGWTTLQLAAAVAGGAVSAEEVTHAHLRRIAELDGTLNALVRVDAGAALRAARAVDRRRARGAALGPLAGVPFVVKDNLDVRRQVTTAGSRAGGGVVARYDAAAVARVRAAGAVLLGRANMDELAMGASTRTSVFGATHNPWDPARSPGGSSGGSAAAVSAGLAAFSIGTDTGGSIREPAAQCGIVGLAPSPGLVPVTGVVPFAPAFDRVGPLTRSVDDAAVLTAVLAGRTWRAAGATPRVGVVRELAGAPNQPGVRAQLAAAVERLRRAGVEVVDVSIPDAAGALPAYMTLTSVACLPHLQRFLRSGRAGTEVVRRAALGEALRGSPELTAAESLRTRLVVQADAAIAGCTALLSPTMPITAPTWESLSGAGELTDPMRAPYTDCWTVVANLIGWPAVSVPAGMSPDDGLPVGVMLSGRPGSDGALLQLAGQAAMSTLLG